jgi:hypothetical protein
VTGYRRQVAEVVRAVTVTSPTSFAWFGARSRSLPRAVLAAVPAATARGYLVDTLERELYRSFYTQSRPVPKQPDRGATRPDDAFVRALSEANSGSGGWEPGWRVTRVDRETARVERDGLSLRAPLADCRVADGRCAPGATVSLRRPKELDAGAPGFYLALGDALPSLGRVEPELRVYFNLAPTGAEPLVATAARHLNAARIPFSLKVIDHPAAFDRCDAAVLYLEHGRFDAAGGSLTAIVAACEPYLRPVVPAFTRPIAQGVAVGEHLASLGPSFGSSRCRLVAEGIVAAHERRERGLADRVAAVARVFADHGLDLDAPYLAPGSTATYAL